MSRLLTDSTTNVPMPESRRRRVRGLLSTLRAQRFYGPASDGEKGVNVGEPYSFVFENAPDAVAAYRERLPKMIELAKAIAVARLEIIGEYTKRVTMPSSRSSATMASIQKTLLCFRIISFACAAELAAAESDLILQAFVAGMPAKIVVQTDDLLEQSPIGSEYMISGLRSRQLVSTSIGFGATFCNRAVQICSGSSEQIFPRDILFRAKVFSVFSGGSVNGIPSYLTAAAAASRASGFTL